MIVNELSTSQSSMGYGQMTEFVNMKYNFYDSQNKIRLCLYNIRNRVYNLVFVNVKFQARVLKKLFLKNKEFISNKQKLILFHFMSLCIKKYT